MLLALRWNVTSATPATSDDVFDLCYTKQHVYSPKELSESQLFDSELQPVTRWIAGEAPTQNEMQFQGKITLVLWNWRDRLQMLNVFLNVTDVLPYVRRTLRASMLPRQ